MQVPINDKFLISDLLKKIDLPLILVCKTSLGTINHSLLSIELIRNKKINFKVLFLWVKILLRLQKQLNLLEKNIRKKIQILGNIPFKKNFF